MSGISRKTLAILALLSVSTGFMVQARPDTSPVPVNGFTLIAHAGGGLPQGTYSNTLEAFDKSARHNFRLIETDLGWTKSGELVLVHDWDTRYYQYYSSLSLLGPILAPFFPVQAKTRKQFMAMKMNDNLHQMDLQALFKWMRAHPKTQIVTDIKDSNVKALAIIAAKAGELKSRFIPQIYAPREYTKVKALGFDNIIFTAYRSPLNNAALVKFVSKNQLFALTIPARRATAKLVKAVGAHNTPVYTHTLNTKKEAAQMARLGVKGMYTDYLVPGK